MIPNSLLPAGKGIFQAQMEKQNYKIQAQMFEMDGNSKTNCPPNKLSLCVLQRAWRTVPPAPRQARVSPAAAWRASSTLAVPARVRNVHPTRFCVYIGASNDNVTKSPHKIHTTFTRFTSLADSMIPGGDKS